MTWCWGLLFFVPHHSACHVLRITILKTGTISSRRRSVTNIDQTHIYGRCTRNQRSVPFDRGWHYSDPVRGSWRQSGWGNERAAADDKWDIIDDLTFCLFVCLALSNSDCAPSTSTNLFSLLFYLFLCFFALLSRCIFILTIIPFAERDLRYVNVCGSLTGLCYISSYNRMHALICDTPLIWYRFCFFLK